ncbi:hypothetical protein A9K97_gp377 [Tokyovirus A1]|uniref:hypothetical protein n=1 Tax=Tokyovirus A1 TaxID=1826170 RepID=UPI0007A981FB|nr:hypothetical protein A9K97_gp377 [Tokyovirus A1]BAU79974.1 conserved hypothetical protein [Tokyovirus A1]
MAGIWYSSTDSVLVSSEKYINKEGEYVDPPALPEFSVMSQSDFYKSFGKDQDWEAFLSGKKEKFAKEQAEYKAEMDSLTIERKDIGRFYTPILCPKPEIVSSEPQGRKFHVSESLFGGCTALSSLQDFELEEENYKEGEPDNGECTRLPFHYLYCKTAVDFLLWREQNKEVEYKDLAPHLREILLKNYGEIVTEEENEQREKTKEEVLSFQRENCKLVDNFRLTDRFNLLYELSTFLGNEDLLQAAGHANAEAVRGFTPKDFRIQLDKPDIPMEEKRKIYEKLSWLNEKDIEIN